VGELVGWDYFLIVSLLIPYVSTLRFTIIYSKFHRVVHT